MFFSKYFKLNIQLRRGTVQDGQNSLLQLGVSLKRVIKCFFSSKLNSSLFLINLICSEGKSAHNLGKENKGILEMVTLRLKGMAMSSSLRSSTWSWPSLLILFVTQVLLKLMGRKPLENCCMNWSLKKRARVGKGKILSSLNWGSVWELYFEFVIIRMACFCLLKRLFRKLSLVLLQIWIA